MYDYRAWHFVGDLVWDLLGAGYIEGDIGSVFGRVRSGLTCMTIAWHL